MLCLVVCFCVFCSWFFFFKQKTAYEMRSSDWSSDVCSSDLLGAMAEVLGDRDAAVGREISKTFEETVTGRLSELSARYVDAPPKGEIVVVVAPPGEAPPPSQEDSDAALREAMGRLPVSKAAGEVAKALGLDRRALYARAMILKSEV